MRVAADPALIHNPSLRITIGTGKGSRRLLSLLYSALIRPTLYCLMAGYSSRSGRWPLSRAWGLLARLPS